MGSVEYANASHRESFGTNGRTLQFGSMLISIPILILEFEEFEEDPWSISIPVPMPMPVPMSVFEDLCGYLEVRDSREEGPSQRLAEAVPSPLILFHGGRVYYPAFLYTRPSRFAIDEEGRVLTDRLVNNMEGASTLPLSTVSFLRS